MCSEADTWPSGVDRYHLSCSVKLIFGGKPRGTYVMWKIKPGLRNPADLGPRSCHCHLLVGKSLFKLYEPVTSFVSWECSN